MDQIPAIPWNTSPMITREPTYAAFQPLLEKNKSLITSVSKRAFKFGETERHYLDVYYPPNSSQASSNDPVPVLFFVYGGGFVTGSRNRPPPQELIYSCLGSFFARQGFITIIPDYRLAPEFKYPSAIQDLLQAIQWALSHPATLALETTPEPDLDSLFVMGHSAGAVHTATLILHPTLIPKDSDLRRRIKGIILASGPYHYYRGETETGHFEAHWGSKENAKENSAVSLLIKSLDWLPRDKLPRTLLVAAQFEPEWIMDLGVDYRRLLEWRFGEPVILDVVKDHNHISLNCALSSGEGEEWGIRTADWIKSVTRGMNFRAYTPADILTDIHETDTRECSRCQRWKIRSFTLEIGTQPIHSQTFFACLDCGNKWTESQSH